VLSWSFCLGCDEIALFGTGDEAETLIRFAPQSSIRIARIYGDPSSESYPEVPAHPLNDLKNYPGTFVLGDRKKVDIKVKRLNTLGMPLERVVVLI